MLKKIATHIFLIIILTVLQVGFLSALPWPAANLNIILAAAIFVAIIIDAELALWCALGAGTILEIFSIFHYGCLLISLLAAVFLINWLFRHFFTNRSFYSLMALGLVGSIFYYLLILGLDYFFYLIKLNPINIAISRFYFIDLFWQIIFALILLAGMFLLASLITRKLSRSFLIER